MRTARVNLLIELKDIRPKKKKTRRHLPSYGCVIVFTFYLDNGLSHTEISLARERRLAWMLAKEPLTPSSPHTQTHVALKGFIWNDQLINKSSF